MVLSFNSDPVLNIFMSNPEGKFQTLGGSVIVTAPPGSPSTLVMFSRSDANQNANIVVVALD
ncbi:hypothetical protein [Bacillus cereus]|uniref:hypothetical protein n=1 Tax=Bacillus cereus TaxID=1396 RepID=UPI0035CA4610